MLTSVTAIALTLFQHSPHQHGGPSSGAQPGAVATIAVRIDSARREVRFTLGPLRPDSGELASGHAEHRHGGTWLASVQWPVRGSVRGFTITVRDEHGRVLPRQLLHHLNLINYRRRQLAYPIWERLVAVGQETPDLSLPRSIGVPVELGSELGLLVALAPGAPAAVFVELVLPWTAPNQNPRPVAVLPVSFDVGFDPGQSDAFDLPVGVSTSSAEFTVPVTGRLLGVGGHLHDYGRWLRIEEAESGKVMLVLRAETDSAGRLRSVESRLFGVTGDGLRLERGRRYRVVAEYDNPTGQILKDGAMAVIGGLFAPDRPADWPALDERDAAFQLDALGLRGATLVGSVLTVRVTPPAERPVP